MYRFLSEECDEHFIDHAFIFVHICLYWSPVVSGELSLAQTAQMKQAQVQARSQEDVSKKVFT